jgi:hypothetical protein
LGSQNSEKKKRRKKENYGSNSPVYYETHTIYKALFSVLFPHFLGDQAMQSEKQKLKRKKGRLPAGFSAETKI